DEHTIAISEERDRSGDSDTSRFLLAGARRALWVRTKQGYLAEAMPTLRQRIADAADLMVESNSIMKFLRPNLYLTVLDYETADFKTSAREFLDLADAVLLHETAEANPTWDGVSLTLLQGKPVFWVQNRTYVSPNF